MLLIKLGGSVITDKSKLKTFKAATVKRLAAEIKASGEKAIIVHGAGSFGHIRAKKYGLQHGYTSDKQISGLSQVHEDVRELNLLVIQCLRAGGLCPISIPPSASVVCTSKKIKNIDFGTFAHYIELGLVPVTFGDVARDTSRMRFCICSGDQLMLVLARHFSPERVIFVTDVDGVYTKNPKERGAKLLPIVTKNTKLDAEKTGVADVTDAMDGKLRTMFEIASMGIETVILNGSVKGRLGDAVAGKKTVCTRLK